MNRDEIIETLIDNDIRFNTETKKSYVDIDYFHNIIKKGFKGYDNYTDEELLDECNERGISVLEIKENFEKTMNTYTVLYRENKEDFLSHPLPFMCEADNADHAEEQCENAYPDSYIVWVTETDNYNVALDDYYNLDL